MAGALLALALQAAAAPKPLLPIDAPECRYDRTAMLALGEDAFDQDFNGGWRAISERGCELTAADLVRDYRTVHKPTLSISFWHEGQLRADAGQTEQAIALFDRARHPAKEDATWGWNLYVDGSIAFLRHDRDGLQAARDTLAALPLPKGYAADLRRPDGTPASVKWPLNLAVLDGFLRCFDRDYRTAYGCAKPIMTFQAK